MTNRIPSDIEIAQAAKLRSIRDVALDLGLTDGELMSFGTAIRDLYPSAGAAFVVALAGDSMTMQGLGRVPAAERMKVTKQGRFAELF